MTVWLSLAAAAAAVAVLELVLRRWWLARWAERGFTVGHFPGWGATLVRVGLALAASSAGLWLGVWQAGVTAAMLVWLAALASAADLADNRIPREPCWTVLGAGTAVALTGFSAAGLASAVTAFLSVAFISVLVAVVTRGGLGSGDVRLLLAFTAGAWWFGYTPTLIGLFAASLLQVLFRFVLFRRRTREDGYPFAPALSLGYAAAVVLFTTPGTVCEEWMMLLSCRA